MEMIDCTRCEAVRTGNRSGVCETCVTEVEAIVELRAAGADAATIGAFKDALAADRTAGLTALAFTIAEVVRLREELARIDGERHRWAERWRRAIEDAANAREELHASTQRAAQTA